MVLRALLFNAVGFVVPLLRFALLGTRWLFFGGATWSGQVTCIPRDLLGGPLKHTSCLMMVPTRSLGSKVCPSLAFPLATPRSVYF